MRRPVIRPRRWWKSATIGALAAASLIVLVPVAAQVPQASSAARGKQLYYQQGCYGCHGFNGETGERRLVGSPIVATPGTFIAFLRLRSDLMPLLPSTRMPSFPTNTLSDAEALDLYAYVRSFVLHAPDPQGIAAFRKILESAQGSYKPSP
jgi:mono/diheme cytochrome c family protein